MQQDPVLSSLKLVSPRAAESRGSHLAFSHPSAYAICQALIAKKIIADFRSPDILRIGLSPLILRFTDIRVSVRALSEIMQNQSYKQAKFEKRQQVT